MYTNIHIYISSSTFVNVVIFVFFAQPLYSNVSCPQFYCFVYHNVPIAHHLFYLHDYNKGSFNSNSNSSTLQSWLRDVLLLFCIYSFLFAWDEAAGVDVVRMSRTEEEEEDSEW